MVETFNGETCQFITVCLQIFLDDLDHETPEECSGPRFHNLLEKLYLRVELTILTASDKNLWR